jgi:hypothetical protein
MMHHVMCISLTNLSSLCYLQRADVSISVVAGHEKKSGSSVAVVEMRREDPDQAARECEDDDGDDEQECLMRRTLLAHTDYIYTQGKHN